MSLLKSSVHQNNRTHEKQVQATALAFLKNPADFSRVFLRCLSRHSGKPIDQGFLLSLIPIANGLIISLTVVEGV